MDKELRARLAHAATRYDRRQARGRFYNPNALALILGGIDRAAERMAKGATVRAALCATFNDRLLDAMLKAAGEAPGTLAEIRGDGQWLPL